jgi:hypothetical protein
MKEAEIMERAIEAFKQQTQIKAKWKATPNQTLDGVIDLYFDKNNPVHFLVEVKREIRNNHLMKLLDIKKRFEHLMVVAENVQPKVKEELQRHNIGYMETNGNIYLRIPPEYFIWIDHKKPKAITKDVNRAFTKTGLKVLFLFLQDEANINRTYREIAALAEVGLGNVNNIIKGLKALRLLVNKNAREYVLAEKKSLLEKWIQAYDDRLKPTIHLGNYRFLNNDAFFKWRNLRLKSDVTFWGGEPAGDLYTNNLNPEILTLYTTETRAEVMKNYRLVPDEKGNVHVY